MQGRHPIPRNEVETRIVRLVSLTPGCVTSQLCDMIGLSAAAMNIHLRDMVNKGCLTRVQQGNHFAYYLSDKEG